MTNKDHKQLASKIKATAKQVTRSSADAKKFLNEAGICDKNGNLKKPYR